MEHITSLQNPLVKELAKLSSAAERRKSGMFILEGIKLCDEALRCGLKICSLWICDTECTRHLTERCSAPVYFTTDAVIAKLSTAKTPQKAVMVARIPDESDRKVQGNIVLALDGISDPANLGSMIRTAEAFGVTDVVCSDTTVDLYSTKVLRGAMGSSFRIHLHRGNLKERLLSLKKEGYRIYVTGLSETSILLHQTDFSEKCVVVIGNEGNGVTDEIFALADQTILIPMAGQNESLNAAAAAAVVLWQGYKGNRHG